MQIVSVCLEEKKRQDSYCQEKEAILPQFAVKGVVSIELIEKLIPIEVAGSNKQKRKRDECTKR